MFPDTFDTPFKSFLSLDIAFRGDTYGARAWPRDFAAEQRTGRSRDQAGHHKRSGEPYRHYEN